MVECNMKRGITVNKKSKLRESWICFIITLYELTQVRMII